jgi:hypothetical protein
MSLLSERVKPLSSQESVFIILIFSIAGLDRLYLGMLDSGIWRLGGRLHGFAFFQATRILNGAFSVHYSNSEVFVTRQRDVFLRKDICLHGIYIAMECATNSSSDPPILRATTTAFCPLSVATSFRAFQLICSDRKSTTILSVSISSSQAIEWLDIPARYLRIFYG